MAANKTPTPTREQLIEWARNRFCDGSRGGTAERGDDGQPIRIPSDAKIAHLDCGGGLGGYWVDAKVWLWEGEEPQAPCVVYLDPR